MQDHLPCEDKEKHEEEVEEELIEKKVSILMLFKNLKMARKYIQQFDVQDHIH